MPLWKLTLAYDGTAFHGWQIQPTLPTIQGTLAQALHHLTGETVLPQGSGRTDTGVHALAQVCSFALASNIPPANLLRALNRALPPAIRILTAEHAPADFHARHSVSQKTYEYRLLNDPAPCPPWIAPYVWDCPWNPDPASLHQTAAQILGTHDFQSFAASDPDQSPHPRPTVKTILTSTWTQESRHPEPPLLIYRVTGTGFLHHMVRNLVGTFVDIARGAQLPPIPQILAARDRSAAGPTAPAHGLFLHSVVYR